MGKKAIISISSNQSSKREDIVEVVTAGNFYKKDNHYFAVYQETEISGMEGTTTTLKITSEKLSLIRVGTTNAKMNFELDREDVSLYNTPFGVLEIKIKTLDINIMVGDNGGNVDINYDMSIAGQKPQTTMLKVNIKA